VCVCVCVCVCVYILIQGTWRDVNIHVVLVVQQLQSPVRFCWSSSFRALSGSAGVSELATKLSPLHRRGDQVILIRACCCLLRLGSCKSNMKEADLTRRESPDPRPPPPPHPVPSLWANTGSLCGTRSVDLTGSQ